MQMKRTIYLLLVFPFLQLAAQPQYLKGYVIGLDSQRTEGLILVNKWWKNPQRISWIPEKGAARSVGPEDILEFGIYGQENYISAKVLIDTTGLNDDEPSRQPNIVWSKKTLFLRVLVEGEASLYYYEQDDLRRFFYRTPDEPLSQLIYKVYQKDEVTAFRYMGYMSQLWEKLRCGEVSEFYVQSIAYGHEDLMRYFREYNECSGKMPAVNHRYTRRPRTVNVKLSPGMSVFDFSFRNGAQPPSIFEYGLVQSPRLALELEMFPYVNSNWSVLLEPAYHRMRLDNTVAIVRYNAIEHSVGLRRYLYARPNSALFSNLHFTFWLANVFDSEIRFAPTEFFGMSLPLNTGSPSFSLGFGYIWMNKLSAEIRISSNKNIIEFVQSRWKTTMYRTGFILSYNLFSRSSAGFRNKQP